MTTTPTERGASLTSRVAAEIRAWMGRRQISGAALARALDQSEAWVSLRINGKQGITLTDLERIAEALAVTPADLLPADMRSVRQPSAWRSPGGTQDQHAKVAHTDRPRDNRPSGRPDRPVTTHPGPRRPRRIPNPQPVPPAHIAA